MLLELFNRVEKKHPAEVGFLTIRSIVPLVYKTKVNNSKALLTRTLSFLRRWPENPSFIHFNSIFLELARRQDWESVSAEWVTWRTCLENSGKHRLRIIKGLEEYSLDFPNRSFLAFLFGIFDKFEDCREELAEVIAAQFENMLVNDIPWALEEIRIRLLKLSGSIEGTFASRLLEEPIRYLIHRADIAGKVEIANQLDLLLKLNIKILSLGEKVDYRANEDELMLGYVAKVFRLLSADGNTTAESSGDKILFCRTSFFNVKRYSSVERRELINIEHRKGRIAVAIKNALDGPMKFLIVWFFLWCSFITISQSSIDDLLWFSLSTNSIKSLLFLVLSFFYLFFFGRLCRTSYLKWVGARIARWPKFYVFLYVSLFFIIAITAFGMFAASFMVFFVYST
jgi:hypothetical protein